MSNIHDLSLSQLRRAVEIKEQIESLEQELASLSGGTVAPPTNGAPVKRRMSAAARAKIRAGQIARWARIKGTAGAAVEAPAVKKKRKVSAAVKARLSEIARKRWAAAKASGKKAL